MWLRLLANPLVWAVLSAGVATFALWGWNQSRETNRNLRNELRASERIIEVLEDYSDDRQRIEETLYESLEALANVPTTSTCGPAVGVALDRLRSQR